MAMGRPSPQIGSLVEAFLKRLPVHLEPTSTIRHLANQPRPATLQNTRFSKNFLEDVARGQLGLFSGDTEKYMLGLQSQDDVITRAIDDALANVGRRTAPPWEGTYRQKRLFAKRYPPYSLNVGDEFDYADMVWEPVKNRRGYLSLEDPPRLHPEDRGNPRLSALLTKHEKPRTHP